MAADAGAAEDVDLRATRAAEEEEGSAAEEGGERRLALRVDRAHSPRRTEEEERTAEEEEEDSRRVAETRPRRGTRRSTACARSLLGFSPFDLIFCTTKLSG